eukprot:scaffold21004_cov80-Skeletonema_dohrnii-CCMP3373.AAC.1
MGTTIFGNTVHHVPDLLTHRMTAPWTAHCLYIRPLSTLVRSSSSFVIVTAYIAYIPNSTMTMHSL